MTVSLDQLANYIGASRPDDDEALERVFTAARVELERALEDNWRPMPESDQDECFLRIAANLFRSGKAGGMDSGGFQLGANNVPTGAVANDPLQKAWPIINRYRSRL